MMDHDSNPPPVPWTESYEQLRQRTLQSVVRDGEVLERFSHGTRLPAGYGRGLDERCIEYPWLVAQMPSGPARLLDAGAVLNHAFLLDLPVFADKRLHIVTLAPEPVCFWERGISYVFEDLRALPYRDNLYDLIVCGSTLEHVGCDNTFYAGPKGSAEHRLYDFLIAARELGRVLKPGGLLLLTVPYGRYESHGTFQQFDRQRLRQAVEAVGGASFSSERFYRITREGWQPSTAPECAECTYVEWVADLMRTGRRPDPVELEPDYAAAARAVACVRLIKA